MKSNLVSGKLPTKKTAPHKIVLYENTPYEYFPNERSPCESYPPEICPWENCPPTKIPPEKITPSPLHEISSPLINHTNERKKSNYKVFGLEESCATQHPYQNNQGPLRYTDNLIKNTRLRYFLYRMKNTQKKNKSKNC